MGMALELCSLSSCNGYSSVYSRGSLKRPIPDTTLDFKITGREVCMPPDCPRWVHKYPLSHANICYVTSLPADVTKSNRLLHAKIE